MTKPTYRLPFDCSGGFYRGTTYPGHSSFSTDYNGVDGSDIGDPVHASIDAVVYEYFAPNGQMKTRDSSGYECWYVHLINPKVSVGDHVRVGDHIADLGNSGIGSTGPHLHINHALDGKQIQIVWDGVPEPASVAVNTKYRSGPLWQCETANPKPKPEANVQVKSWAGWTGSTALLVQGADIENAAGVKLTTAAKVPPVFPYLGETPLGRAIVGIETGNGAPAGTLRSIAAYVKPAGVVSVSPPGDCGPNVKAGREAFQQEAILALTALQP